MAAEADRALYYSGGESEVALLQSVCLDCLFECVIAARRLEETCWRRCVVVVLNSWLLHHKMAEERTETLLVTLFRGFVFQQCDMEVSESDHGPIALP